MRNLPEPSGVSFLQGRGWIWIIALSAVFVILRFWHLEADFPVDMTWSGVLFRDEGWYSNAAVRHAHGLPWYIEGDFNPSVSMPLGQLILRGTFLFMEPSLVGVRLVSATAYALGLIGCALIVWRALEPRPGVWGASVTALVLAVSYLGMVYSRLSIMEHIGLAFVVLSVLLLVGRAPSIPRVVFAALAAACAIAVKSNMIFVVAVGLVLILMGASGRRQIITSCAGFILTGLLLVGTVQLFLSVNYPEDVAYFKNLNLQGRLVGGLDDWLVTFLSLPVEAVKAIGLPLSLIMAIPIMAGLLFDASYRRAPVVVAMLVWIVTYFALSAVLNYTPKRYMLPVLPPAAILAGSAVSRFLETGFGWRIKIPLITFSALAGLVLLMEAYSSWSYFSSLKYSMVRMTEEVDGLVRTEAGTSYQPLLVGQFADMIALETGIPAVNSELGVQTIAQRLENGVRPTHVISNRPNDPVFAAIEVQGGGLVEIGVWDVLENYHTGAPVRLFRVIW